MRRQKWAWYALAAAIGVGGLLSAGVRLSTMVLAGLALMCPLMMLFWHTGGHRGHHHTDQARPHRSVRPTPPNPAHHDHMASAR